MRRSNPEHVETAVPIRVLMGHAGFYRSRCSATVYQGGRFLSAVTTGTFDEYFFHPKRGLSVWVDYKRRKGGEASPEQLAFAKAHESNPTRAFIWHDPALCRAWLIQHGFLTVDGGVDHFPFGIHAPAEGPTEQVWLS